MDDTRSQEVAQVTARSQSNVASNLAAPSTSVSDRVMHSSPNQSNSVVSGATNQLRSSATHRLSSNSNVLYSAPSSTGIGHGHSLSSSQSASNSACSPATDTGAAKNQLDMLLAAFVSEDITTKQVTSIYSLARKDYERASECLLQGPTLKSIIHMVTEIFSDLPRFKVFLDSESIWKDLVGYYKCPTMNYFSRVCVSMDDVPAIDTGGVRRQVYSTVFREFALNKHIHLFDGPTDYLRPAATAQARSSGLMKHLGTMISHSICQNGIGFPYLSPFCYWYFVGGEDKALQYVTVEDLPADSTICIAKVKHSSTY